MASKIPQVLMKAGLATKEQILKAVEYQKANKKPFGMALEAIGVLDEGKIASAVAESMGLELLEEGRSEKVAPDVLSALPVDTAKKYRVIPVAKEGDKLRVAIADPTNKEALESISKSAGVEIECVVSRDSVLLKALKRHYLKKGDDDESKKLKIPKLKQGQLDKIKPAQLGLLPIEIVKKYSVIPLKRDDGTLTVIFPLPIKKEAIEGVEKETGLEIKAMAADQMEVSMNLKRCLLELEERVEKKKEEVSKQGEVTLPEEPAAEQEKKEAVEAETTEEAPEEKKKSSLIDVVKKKTEDDEEEEFPPTGPPYPERRLENISDDLVKLLEAKDARRLLMVPIAKQKNTLFVAMAEPNKGPGVHAVEETIGLFIRPIQVSENAFNEALNKYYPPPKREASSSMSLVPQVTPDQLETIDANVLSMVPDDIARKYSIIPIGRTGPKLFLAMADPTNIFAISDVNFITSFDVEPLQGTEDEILDAIEKHYGVPADIELKKLMEEVDGEDGVIDSMEFIDEEEEDVDIHSIEAASEDAPVVKMVNLIIHDSLKRGASDIHIEPLEEDMRVRYRIDGTLYETFSTNKTHRDAAYWLITGYLAAGRIETAWDFAREAHGLYPHDAGMIALNALAAYVNGDYEGAEKLFREALELAPDDPVILVNFSLVLIVLNKPDEARSLLEMITDHHAATPIATRARRIDEELIGGQ